MNSRVWKGELLRWYLKRARHPLKDYLVGHYWWWFSTKRVWVKYDGDSAISVSLGDYIQERIFFDDYYERPLVQWLKQHLRASDVFWDVGANIGAVTLVAARLCGRVIAFEPNPQTAALLRRNLETNRIGNVTVVEAALCDRSGTAVLHQGPANNSGMSSIVAARGARDDGTSVAVERADDVVAQDPSRHPTVVKLDVEGGEHLVLRGARQLLSSTRVRAIVFENARDARGQAADSSVIDCLCAAGFRIHELGPSVPEAPDGLSNFIAVRTSADTAAR